MQHFRLPFELIRDNLVIRLRNRLFFTIGDVIYAGNNIVSPGELRLYISLERRNGLLILVTDVKLQWLDLDRSFSVDGDIPNSVLQNTTDNTKPSFTGDAFWTDANETTVYTLGQPDNQPHDGQSTLNAYNVQGDVWRDVSVTGGPFNKGSSLTTMYASSSAGGVQLSFISGGFDAFQNGLVIFNSSDPQNLTWKNVTNDDLPYFRQPLTQYIRYGSAGILAVIGGFIATGDDAALRQMNSIQIYDIAAAKWFTQIATGDAPPRNVWYCSALSAAPDDSSMHLILYGGLLNDQGNIDEEHANQAGVYMLVMPAFHWIKINTTYATGLTRTTEGRISHKCITYKDRQLLVFGGRYGQLYNENVNCRTFSPLRMLDLTTFQWQTEWPLKNTTYQVPQAVIDIVGGGPSGGAKPANTWQQALGDHVSLFSKTIPRYDPDHPPQNNVSTNASPKNGAATTISSTPDAGSSERKGAITGAVVGGVAGLTLISVAVFLVFRRRRSQRRCEAEEQPWHKPELGNEREKAFLATRRGSNRQHEMGCQLPAAFQFREMDGQGRVELLDMQSLRYNKSHELPG
ncbi:MAG: hypothetical protein Q9214_000127 [Letrouitia sp. 1 TL-2023]